MTADELLREFRILTQDRLEPYRWDKSWVLAWLKEGEGEAAIRARLLHESDDPDVCEIVVRGGAARYDMHQALYEITHLAYRPTPDARRVPVKLVSEEYLDGRVRDWRDRSGSPEYAIQGDTTLRLVPKPIEDGLLLLEGYRLPYDKQAEDWQPEINSAHHRHLTQWALFRAYSLPDADLLDPERAALAEQAFTAYFGARPDSDLRRIVREDQIHHNLAWP